MSTSIEIDVNKLSDYSGITLTDLGNNIGSITDILLNIYTPNNTTPSYTYTFTVGEVAEYITYRTVDLTFIQLMSREYALDNWYDVELIGNSGDYVSNKAGFGSDAYITVLVNENINNVHTPDQNRGNIENLAMQRMFLDGLKYLDTSTINDRSIKWKKRYNVLSKMNQ